MKSRHLQIAPLHCGWGGGCPAGFAGEEASRGIRVGTVAGSATGFSGRGRARASRMVPTFRPERRLSSFLLGAPASPPASVRRQSKPVALPAPPRPPLLKAPECGCRKHHQERNADAETEETAHGLRATFLVPIPGLKEGLHHRIKRDELAAGEEGEKDSEDFLHFDRIASRTCEALPGSPRSYRSSARRM